MIETVPRIYQTEFVMGVFNGAAEQVDELIVDRQDTAIDAALCTTVQELIANSHKHDVKVGFRLALDEYGESRAIRSTMIYMEHTIGVFEPSGSRNLLFERGGLQTAEDFHTRFRIPGKLALYKELGLTFINQIRN